MGYTELELKVIKTFGSFMNYDTLEANLNDNCTCVDAKDVARLTGLDIKQVKGVLSSLEQKNLLFIDITNINHRTLMVTNDGVVEYFKLKEASNMVKVIEKATGTQYQAKAIEGGFEVFTLEGERYKKLKESTFKRYFKKVTESEVDDVAEAEEVEQNKKKASKKTKKSEKKQESEPTPEPQAEEEQTQEEDPVIEPDQKQEEEHEEPKKADKNEEPKVNLDDVSRDNMIEKIKKMLNLSLNNPSAEEAASAALMAQKLMAKYGIHEEDVTLEEVKDEIKSMSAVLKHDSSLHSWRKGLGNIVAKNFRVKCYINGSKDIVFRGYKEDVKIAVEVFKYLYALGNKLGSKAYHEALQQGSGKGVYNSFVLGFLQGVEDALNEQCTALMIVTPKEVEEEFAEFSKNMEKSSTRINGTKNSTYESGVIEGKNAVKSRQINDKKNK